VNAQQRLARLTRTVGAGRTSTAARTPFVLLIVVLLGSGLLALLLLNASLNKGSFQVTRLEQRTTELEEEEQALEQEVASYSDPAALRGRAREMGMVPGGPPAFLEPDGTVRGSPAPATELPSPPPEEQPEDETEETQVPAEAGPSATPGASGGPREPQPRVQPEESAGSARPE
jgi:cell division protein FtsB